MARRPTRTRVPENEDDRRPPPPESDEGDEGAEGELDEGADEGYRFDKPPAPGVPPPEPPQPARQERGRRDRPHREAPPEDETKHDRFIRIGTRRVNTLLRQIKLLGNLASANYEPSPEDIDAMHTAINREMDKAFGRFERARREAMFSFTHPPRRPNGDKGET